MRLLLSLLLLSPLLVLAHPTPQFTPPLPCPWDHFNSIFVVYSPPTPSDCVLAQGKIRKYFANLKTNEYADFTPSMFNLYIATDFKGVQNPPSPYQSVQQDSHGCSAGYYDYYQCVLDPFTRHMHVEHNPGFTWCQLKNQSAHQLMLGQPQPPIECSPPANDPNYI